MAAKVDKKFLLVVLAVCVVVAAAVSAAAFWAYRTGPVRNMAEGDRLFQEGNYHGAMRAYGRAVNREGSNLEYLQKYEDAIAAYRPETRNAAREAYQQFVQVKRHRANILQTDIDAQIQYLDLMREDAELGGGTDMWSTLSEFAALSMRHFARDTEEYLRLRGYKMLADINRVGIMTTEDIEATEAAMLEHLEEYPVDERARRAMLTRLFSQANQAQVLGQTLRMEDLEAQAEEMLAEGLRINPDSLDLMLVEIRRAGTLAFSQVRGSEEARERLQAAVEKVHALAEASDDLPLVADSATVLVAVDRDRGIDRAETVVRNYLEQHPETPFLELVLANLFFESGRHDQGRAAAENVVGIGPLPTGQMSMRRRELQERAAKLMFDVEYAVAMQAVGADRTRGLERAQAARDTLGSLVTDSDLNLLIAEADAWLAMSRGDYRTAVSRFEFVLSRIENPSTRLLYAAATALDRQNESGRAMDRLRMALEISPTNQNVLADAARIALTIGAPFEARTYANRLMQVNPEHPAVRALLLQTYVARDEQPPADLQVEPELEVVREAEMMARRGELAGALSMLIPVSEEMPDNPQLSVFMAQIEAQLDMREQAIERLQRAQLANPGEMRIASLLASLQIEDPVERIRQIVTTTQNDEVERAVMMYVMLRQFQQYQEALADQMSSSGQRQQADAAREAAERLSGAADEAMANAERVAPNHRDYVEQRFQDALAAREWPMAERLTQRAKDTDADDARGLTFQARLDVARDRPEAAILALNDAVSIKPYSSSLWRALADTYIRVGNVPDAISAYQEAIDRRPNDAVTIAMFARLLEETGDRMRALELLRRGRDLNVPNPELREAWLITESQIGNRPVAMRERERILRSDPSNIINALRLARLYGSATPQREDVLLADGDPEYTVAAWNALTSVERDRIVERIRNTWIERAEGIYQRLASGDVDRLLVDSNRALFYRDLGQVRRGEDILRVYIEDMGDEASAQGYIMLAEYLTSLNRPREAADVLMSGRDRQSDEIREIDMALGTTYFVAGQYALARDVLRDVYERNPTATVTLQLSECYYRLGGYARAEELLQEYAAQHTPTYASELLTAQTAGGFAMELFEAGRDTEAQRRLTAERGAIDKAIAIAPMNPLAYVVKGQSLLREFVRTGRQALLGEAAIALNAAVERQADFVPARRARAHMLTLQNPPDYQGAIVELQQAVRVAPRDDGLRRTLMQMYETVQNRTRAIEVVQGGLELNPESFSWKVELARLYESAGRMADGLQVIRELYASNTSPELGAMYTSMMLRSQRPDAAEIRRVTMAHQDEHARIPVLRANLARSEAIQGRWDQARQTMREARAIYLSVGEDQRNAALRAWMSQVQLLFAGRPATEIESYVRESADGDPSAVELVATAEFWIQTGTADSRSNAIRLLEEAIGAATDEQIEARAMAHRLLGQSHYVQGEHSTAVAQYELALSLNPEDPIALNDLAYIIATQMEDPARALPLAEKAAELMRQNPNILDTLGTVYHLLRQNQEAERAFRMAVDVGAGAGTRVKLARVLIDMGRRDAARGLLEQARSMNPPANLQSEIDQLLSQL